MPRILALLLTFVLTLAGCSGASPLDKVKVGGSADAPKLTVPAEFSVDETTTRVLKKGTGAELRDGDLATLDVVAYNGRTGKQLMNSYASGQSMPISLAKGGTSIKGLVTALTGQRVGGKLLVAIPPTQGFGTQIPQGVDMQTSDTLVFHLRVASKSRNAASGKKQALPADVPSVVVKGGRPTGFTKTASTPATLSESSAHVVIRGDGAKVPKGGTVVAHYLGQVFPQGAVFDASWDRGAPATFPLASVIKCWQDLLPGVPIGSRVVLECTAADAYGDSPQPGGTIKPGDDLLFVVDVLDAH